jgi:hypothetical protein
VQIIDDANYKLKTLTGRKTIIVNKSRLKRCYERKILQEMDNDSLQVHNDPLPDNPVALDDTQEPPPTTAKPITQNKKKSKAKKQKLSKHVSNSKKPPTTATNTSEPLQDESKSNEEHVEIVPDITDTNPITRANPRPLRSRHKPDRFQAGK